MNNQILLRVDTNDGDYEEFVYDVVPKDVSTIVALFKRFPKPYGSITWYGCGGCDYENPHSEAYAAYEGLFSPQEWEFLLNFLPNLEYGFGSIDKVRIIAVLEEIV
jgi:hypothetical protein